MQNVKPLFLAITAIAFLSATFACRSKHTDEPSNQNPLALNPNDLEMPITAVKVWDATLRLYPPIPSSIDKRPTYIVEGRITNLDERKTIGKIVITVYMQGLPDYTQIDKDEITINAEIPPANTQAFARVVHLLPPGKNAKFSWGLEATEIVELR